MTLPFCGFSLAVSGRTIPLAVVSSSSIARTMSRSPRGLSFICGRPPWVVRDSGFALFYREGQPGGREDSALALAINEVQIPERAEGIPAAPARLTTARRE